MYICVFLDLKTIISADLFPYQSFMLNAIIAVFSNGRTDIGS